MIHWCSVFQLEWICSRGLMISLVNSIRRFGILLERILLSQSNLFFKIGFFPKGINFTIMALIPKNETSNTMKDFRLTSWCNVIYKVILKIQPKFISPNQSAFVKDRLLMENVLMASELVKSYYKILVFVSCAIKIDISKVFDTVQWPFLPSALTALGFPGDYIVWIEKCISLASL